MFGIAIKEISRNDLCKIPEGKQTFEKSINYSLGYYDISKNTLYLKPSETYTAVVRYWAEQSIPFTIKDKALRRELLISGFLRGSMEGDVQKSSTPVSIKGKAVRMLEFDLMKFEKKFNAFGVSLNYSYSGSTPHKFY